MADMNNIVKLAIDAYKGNVEKYSVKQSQDALREAIIELNNGKTTLDYKSIRDGKCTGLFAFIEEVLNNTVVEGLQNDDFFMSMVDFRNVALGDAPEFVVEDKNLFVVAEAADGTQGIRRQRISGKTVTTIPTTVKAVRIYEELNRVLSGRVDFNTMIQKVSQSFEQRMLEDVYSLWSKATAADLGGEAFFPTAGAYSEDALLETISHVEAAAGGATATVVGTKKALRNLYGSITTPSMNNSDMAKEEIHSMGYVGHFYGSPVVATPQRHKVGTTEFVMNDKSLTIFAGDEKPLKFIYEGNPIVLMGDPMTNADLTQEFFYAVKTGAGLVLAGNGGIGRYDIA